MTATALATRPTATTPLAPAARTPLWRVTAVELRKMVDTRAGRWLLAVIGLLAVGAVGVRMFTGDAATRDFASYFEISLLPVNLLLPVLAILTVTSEWSQRTALTTFTLVPRRGRIAAAKVLAATAITVVSVAGCLVIAAVGNLIHGGGSWHLGAAVLGYAVLFELIAVLMGVAFGALLMNSATAIVLFFVLPTAWGIAGSLVGALRTPAEWLDTSRTTAPLLSDAMTTGAWARLGVSVAVWVALPALLGVLRLRRSEVK
jgi:hypothetical protein